MKIHIIGGGIIGWSTAWYLNQKGFEVTIIDKEKTSNGCSHGNSGIIVPSHFIPLAAPGVIAKGIKWMFDAKSPFYIKPRMNLELFQWLWQFYRSCTPERASKAMPALLEFNQLSKSLYHQFFDKEEFDFFLQDKGLMMFYKSSKAEKEEKELVEKAQELGLDAKILDNAQAQQLNPNVKIDVLGASYFPSDSHLDPNVFMTQIQERGLKSGIQQMSSCAIKGFQTKKGRIESLISTNGKVIPSDLIILAAGGWSAHLAKQLGIRLLLQGGKGYSITVDQHDNKPEMPVILNEAKVALTPLDNKLRIAGTLEIGGLREKINLKRMQGILESVPHYFPTLHPKMLPKEQIWHGFRPCTPDGLPYIGKHPKFNNLILATGHAMMGMSTGPATGLLVSEILQGKKTSMNIDLFDPAR